MLPYHGRIIPLVRREMSFLSGQLIWSSYPRTGLELQTVSNELGVITLNRLPSIQMTKERSKTGGKHTILTKMLSLLRGAVTSMNHANICGLN